MWGLGVGCHCGIRAARCAGSARPPGAFGQAETQGPRGPEKHTFCGALRGPPVSATRPPGLRVIPTGHFQNGEGLRDLPGGPAGVADQLILVERRDAQPLQHERLHASVRGAAGAAH